MVLLFCVPSLAGQSFSKEIFYGVDCVLGLNPVDYARDHETGKRNLVRLNSGEEKIIFEKDGYQYRLKFDAQKVATGNSGQTCEYWSTLELSLSKNGVTLNSVISSPREGYGSFLNLNPNQPLHGVACSSTTQGHWDCQL